MDASVNIDRIRKRRHGIDELLERLDNVLPYQKKCRFSVLSVLTNQTYQCDKSFRISIRYDKNFNDNPESTRCVKFEFWNKEKEAFVTACQIDQNKYNKEVFTVSDYTCGGKMEIQTEHAYSYVRKKRGRQTLEHRQWAQFEIMIFREFEEVVGMCVLENGKIKCYITIDPETGKSHIRTSIKVVKGFVLPPPILTYSTFSLTLATVIAGSISPVYAFIPAIVSISAVFVCITNDFFNPNRSPWANAIQAITYALTGYAFMFL